MVLHSPYTAALLPYAPDAAKYATSLFAPIAQLDRASDYESAEGGDSNRDAPVTAENLTAVAGALLVAFGRSRRLFTDRTRTVAGSL